MHEPKFLASKKCDKLLCVVQEAEGQVSCCGEAMQELRANTSEGAAEKHLPVVEVNGPMVTVKVGSVFHPMSAEHNIGWVWLVTQNGWQFRLLPVDRDPEATFTISPEDRVLSAYAYCNLHGLWKTAVE